NERMDIGRLLSPSGASARDALLEARRLDPTDPAVAQGIREFAERLTDEARSALNRSDTAEARTYANAARQLGSAGSALAAVERAIADAGRASSEPARQAATPRQPSPPAQPASTNPNAQALAAGVRQRLTEGKLIDPP